MALGFTRWRSDQSAKPQLSFWSSSPPSQGGDRGVVEWSVTTPKPPPHRRGGFRFTFEFRIDSRFLPLLASVEHPGPLKKL